MKKIEAACFLSPIRYFLVPAILQLSIVSAVSAQSAPTTDNPATPANNASAPAVTQPPVPSPDVVQKRLERARALAAAHQLSSAASELESIRASVKDDVVRNNSSLMLMGIYLEDGNYARAESLLEETFKEREQKKERTIGTYFALAGQAVNGARAHIARYRLFGINVSSSGLPAEAANDLERLRSLLERMTMQGKQLARENAKSNDAFALLEDIASIRTTLARDAEDRAKWETEHSLARARMATLPNEIGASAGTTAMPGGDGIAEITRGVPSTIAASVAKQPQPQPISTAPPTSETKAPDTKAVDSKPADDNKGATLSAPTAGAGPFEVGSLLEKATSRIDPVYPQQARNTGAGGMVRVKIVVDETGAVSNILWAEGPMLLRKAAEEALRKWKFQPTMVEGKPVKATGYVDFNFTR